MMVDQMEQVVGQPPAPLSQSQPVANDVYQLGWAHGPCILEWSSRESTLPQRVNKH